MEKVERIFPSNLPKAVGPYPPVIAHGDRLIIAGQIPINPLTGNVDHNDIEWQAHQTMKNLRSTVEGAGSSLTLII
jgi:2-iminobutanoate/2-iminopropanoate deaminase